MKKSNNLIKLGYILALIFFLLSLILRLPSIESDSSYAFMFIGGILLFLTSLFKISLSKKV